VELVDLGPLVAMVLVELGRLVALVGLGRLESLVVLGLVVLVPHGLDPRHRHVVGSHQLVVLVRLVVGPLVVVCLGWRRLVGLVVLALVGELVVVGLVVLALAPLGLALVGPVALVGLVVALVGLVALI
jgi:hypothetical protein